MIDLSNLFHDKVAKAMIAITLGKSKREEKIKNDLEMKHPEEMWSLQKSPRRLQLSHQVCWPQTNARTRIGFYEIEVIK